MRAALAPWILAVVLRDEKLPGEVVRLLPELRCSLQYMLADAYHVRSAEASGEWRALPRAALWAPCDQSAFGYARHHIRAFAIGFTAAGWQTLFPGDVSQVVNQIFDFSALHPELSEAWEPHYDESLADWRARIEPKLCKWFENSERPNAIDQTLSLLASGMNVRDVAKNVNMSERHFRRKFAARFGFAPKMYQRIHRVDRMLRQLHDQPWEPDESSLALMFADQAHSIRDFKSVVGITPKAYVRAKRIGNRTLRSIPVDGVAPPDA
jgi:AraC-like DNA-binding protein